MNEYNFKLYNFSVLFARNMHLNATNISRLILQLQDSSDLGMRYSKLTYTERGPWLTVAISPSIL